MGTLAAPYPVSAEQEVTDAQATAQSLAQQAEQLMLQAEAAKAAAEAAQREAERQARTAQYNGAVESHGGDEAAAKLLCARLSTTPEQLRGAVTLRADGLGVEGARGLAYLFAGSGTLLKLEVLALARNALTDDGAIALADALNPSAPLKQMDLSSNSIGESGTAAIAKALSRGALPKLTTLSLKNNDVGDEGIASIAQTSHGTLEWLNCSGNQIAQPGAAALASALIDGHFPQLRRLGLNHNQLGDDAMHTLASALDGGVTLDELYVECNPASEEAIQGIQSRWQQEDTKAPRETSLSARQACEAASTSIYRGLGNGCVCM